MLKRKINILFCLVVLAVAYTALRASEDFGGIGSNGGSSSGGDGGGNGGGNGGGTSSGSSSDND